MSNLFTDEAAVPVVFERDGAPWTNSRDVAGLFGKRHDHVLRDIDNLLESLDSPKLGSPYYKEVSILDGSGIGRRAFDMTRDGFTLLAMGFTGTEALSFKIAYIEQFNAMESELRARATAPRSLAAQDLRAWLSVVSSAQRLYGAAAARRVWASSPLPQAEIEIGETDGPVDHFLAACTCRDENGFAPAADLYAAYSAWRDQAGGPILNRPLLGREIGRRGYKARSQRVPGRSSAVCWGYPGLRVIQGGKS